MRQTAMIRRTILVTSAVAQGRIVCGISEPRRPLAEAAMSDLFVVGNLQIQKCDVFSGFAWIYSLFVLQSGSSDNACDSSRIT